MVVGLIGRKWGMTQFYTEEGRFVPITVIEVSPNRVTQIKTEEKDGYRAAQVTCGKRSVTRLTKPKLGHFRKADVEAGLGLWELDFVAGSDQVLTVGSSILVADVFKPGQCVSVTGITKGKGFSGVIKRHHFSSQDATHGNSLSHRAPGSIGQRQSPGRVFKGKKMAGQLGNKRRTIQSLEVVKVDVDRNLLLIRGSVPGSPGGFVLVRKAVREGG